MIRTAIIRAFQARPLSRSRKTEAPHLRAQQFYNHHPARRRFFSNKSAQREAQKTSETISDKNAEAAKARSRLNRVLTKLPRFLSSYATALKNAPITHVTSFLLLHEITAVVPLLTLAGAFHYFNWLPPFISEGQWVTVGMEKFGGYFKKKGWFGFTKETELNIREDERIAAGKVEKWWGRGTVGSRVLVEVATAYAITKALLPLRLAISLTFTPWFARVFTVPLTGQISRIFSRKKVSSAMNTTASSKAASAPGVTVAGNPVEKGVGRHNIGGKERVK